MANLSLIITLCLTTSLACARAEEPETVASWDTVTFGQSSFESKPTDVYQSPTPSPVSSSQQNLDKSSTTVAEEMIPYQTPEVMRTPTVVERPAPYSTAHNPGGVTQGTQMPETNGLSTSLRITDTGEKINGTYNTTLTPSKPLEIGQPMATFPDCKQNDSDETVEMKASTKQTPVFTCHNTSEQVHLSTVNASTRPIIAPPTLSQFTPPPVNIVRTDALCEPLKHIEIDTRKGNLTWSAECNSCRLMRSWRYFTSDSHGYVVEFHLIDLKEGDSMMINRLGPSGSTIDVLKVYTANQYLSLAPVFVRGGLEVIIITPREHCRNSSFIISFTAHPLSSLPSVVSNEFRPDRVESRILYNCSDISNLPSAILCDGIQHCEHREDEKHCSYRDQGCGDWFPHNEYCLKATFALRINIISGGTFFTMPLQAEKICHSQNGAELAILPDITGVPFATEMIRKSGFVSATIGIKKVKPVSRRLRHLYRFIWQWGKRGSPIAYELQNLQRSGAMQECGFLQIAPYPSIQPLQCMLPKSIPWGYICMKRNPAHPTRILPSQIFIKRPVVVPDLFPTKECQDGSVVQTFHRCQWNSGKEEEEEAAFSGWTFVGFPLFKCRFGKAVHYSLLCDGLDDCPDSSDEMHCPKPQYPPLQNSSFLCRNLQAIPTDKQCDGITDCFDESDEDACLTCGLRLMCVGFGCVPRKYAQYIEPCPSQPPTTLQKPSTLHVGSVIMDGTGMSITESRSSECPEGYYECLNGLCIPSFLINNGEKDCTKGEDEIVPPHNVTCPGYYRCHTSGSCIHKKHLCDGVYHCPDKDDEMFCSLTCPTDKGCVCEGNAYRCTEMIDPLQNPHVRYLDVSNATNVSLTNFHVMEYLFFLNLSFCQLSNVTFGDMPHLQILDLSSNYFTDVIHLHLYKLSGLLHLNLSNNPFAHTLGAAFKVLTELAELNNLQTLIMVNVSLEGIQNRVYGDLPSLKHLDIRDNDVGAFDKESLWGLNSLVELYTDVPKLCCAYFHASSLECYAPEDELSSCSDLLAKDIFRVFLWALAGLAIVGNIGVLIYRFFVDRRRPTSHPAFSVLVKNLCGSDLLMGVYMAIIGIADAHFQGQYVAKEKEWRNSVACKVAGFLSFVSSEMSAFVICLITLDRVLVISFPFSRKRHLSRRVSIALCCLVWIISFIMAAIPLLLDVEFYGQNGICIPLPITRRQYSGQRYSFGIFIILNFIMFVLIGVGQIVIYVTVRKARKASGSQYRRGDMAIAQRLFLIVFSDFCCWFPVGVMGLLAAGGIPIPGELNVAVAIFVLPLNSALNPFLYTINGLAEQWKKKRMEARTKMLLGKIQTEITKWHPSSVQQLMKMCIQCKSVEKDIVLKWLGVKVDQTSPIRPGTADLSHCINAGDDCKEFTNTMYDDSTVTQISHVHISEPEVTNNTNVNNTNVLHSQCTE